MTTVRDDRRDTGRRTGRRPGHPDTRQAIIEAAGHTFAEAGFSGATVRTIATRAGVDAALINHYFGSKRELFLATVQMPIDPTVLIAQVSAGDLDGLGHRIVAAITGAWESPAQPALLAVVRSALSDAGAARMMREFLMSEIISRVLQRADVPSDESELRGGLVASQVLGMVIARYLLRLEPLASMGRDQLIAAIGPTVQHYITGELPGAMMSVLSPGAER